MRFDSLREELFLLSAQVIFVGFCFLLKLLFTQKTNQRHIRYLLLHPPPPQVYHELTCYHSYRGDEGEEVDQNGDWAGVCCKGKGRIDGGDHKGRETQEGEERGGGMCK